MVVVLLSVFDWIIRIVLMLLLLDMILSWGGVAIPGAAGAGGAGRSASIHASALATEVDDLKQADALVEARKYITDGHQGVLLQPVNDW